ncbi:MAG: aldolase [Candidatus Hydrogenedentes bacterium]|nr:aldolase [Candidatus Hydrogenedentota bacterium]
MNGLELQAALHAGRCVYGTCAISTSPTWPAMVAASGADFVFVDTEHAPIQRDQLAWICRSYTALDVAPVVRIPEPDPYRACMVLDAGAAGVIVPYVESLAQVRDLRGAVRFRPLKGQRLQRVLDGTEQLDADTAAYLAERNAGRLMIVNIESTPALEILDEIAAAPGLDAFLVGPHDLSISLGVPEQYGHPRFNEAISTIIRTARAHNLGVGIHFSDGIERELGWLAEGANFIVHSSDRALVRDALRADFARLREAAGAASPGAASPGAASPGGEAPGGEPDTI